ncbi:hypothetical protein NADFUDRAFT_7673, partial [Nadsonia fulvescens var. elongata DSM 6958]
EESAPYAEELIQEQLSRNRVFLGDSGLQALRDSTVLVAGCGDVGSWVVTMLVRSGCGRVVLVDDRPVLQASDICSHAVANVENVGQRSSAVLKAYLARVAPWVEVDLVLDPPRGLREWHALLSRLPAITYLVDTASDLSTKLDLIEATVQQKIPLVSAISPDGKTDPTAVRLGDIAHTIDDPSADPLRQHLKLRGILSSVPVVYSTEKPKPHRTAKNLNSLPGVYGLVVATHAMTTIAAYDTPVYTTPVRFKSKFYDPSLHALIRQVKALYPEVADAEDQVRQEWKLNKVIYTVEEVFRGHSVISGQVNKWALSIWNRRDTIKQAVDWRNVVLMTKEEAQRHEQLVLEGESCEAVYGSAVCERVEQRWKE